MTKVLLKGEAGDDAVLEIDHEVLRNAAILVYNGQHYVFSGMQGQCFTAARFVAVNPPVEIALQPQPEPVAPPPAPRKFFGKA